MGDFIIKNPKHLQIVEDLLEKAKKVAGWDSESLDEDLKKTITQKDELKKLKQKNQKQKESYKKTVDKLMLELSDLRNEQLTINLEIFKEDLKVFKKLLDNPKEDEKKIQEWLFQHPWVFGPNYLENSKEEITRTGDRIDFLLERYDTYFDIIELKLPSHDLFLKKSNKDKDISREYTMGAKVKDAISQLIGYLETYELDKTSKYWDSNSKISIHKPKGILVIGRTTKENSRSLKTLNSYLHNIEILTYDDIINVGNNFIKIIQNRHKSVNKIKKKVE
ncbi:MAG: DUF4263 domain-containing protein [Candidatus Woesearchaeota archaeon]|nr:MAG: DUF4263 domain-containing protein [Candidatus Woesearchaeota archaeon]